MIKQPLSPVAVVKAGLPANSELDLERWPRWMREALAIQPETTTRAANSVTAVAPARVDPASVRVLHRMPPRS
ncbi:hypothetical protein [Bradyrhizobium sp. AZCC 2230]|uniref:hypothetical protein n=1 Tax=Bradyrhizobium sp. AZCC 2230 TaxID=3117021 RepID=UPI002FEF7B56